MKKIGLIFVIAFLLLVSASAFGNENMMKGNGWAANPDSMINQLDPSNAPTIIPAHSGLMGLTEEGLPGAGGSAAGGPREARDSFVNYVDPSSVPGYADAESGAVTAEFTSFKARGSAAGGMSRELDTFPNYIDPSKLPGYVNLETGVVN